VRKRKSARISSGDIRLDLPPESPYTKRWIISDRGIVEKDDASIGKFGEPVFEVMLYCLVGVASVDVEEVDGSVCELGLGIIEGRNEKFGECPVIRVMSLLKHFEYSGGIESRVRIPLESVNTDRPIGPWYHSCVEKAHRSITRKSASDQSLTKGEVTVPRVDTEFNE